MNSTYTDIDNLVREYKFKKIRAEEACNIEHEKFLQKFKALLEPSNNSYNPPGHTAIKVNSEDEQHSKKGVFYFSLKIEFDDYPTISRKLGIAYTKNSLDHQFFYNDESPLSTALFSRDNMINSIIKSIKEEINASIKDIAI
jgi:hypothetical protein